MKNFCTAFLLTALTCSGLTAFADTSDAVNIVNSNDIRIAQVAGNEVNLKIKKGIINSSMTTQEKQLSLLKLLEEYNYYTFSVIHFIDWDKITDDFAPSFYTALANEYLDDLEFELYSNPDKSKLAAHDERYMQRFNIFYESYEKLNLRSERITGFIFGILNDIIRHQDIADEQIVYKYLTQWKAYNISRAEGYVNQQIEILKKFRPSGVGNDVEYRSRLYELQQAKKDYMQEINNTYNEALSILKKNKKNKK